MRVNQVHTPALTLVVVLGLFTTGCGGGGGGGEQMTTAPSPVIGSAELSWMPPTDNTDGTALTDLSGYEILYGRTSTDLNETINLSNPSLNRYLVENLSTGTWYFAVIAINSQGVRSAASNVASKTISSGG